MTAADGTLSREYRCWKFGDPSPSADSTTVETLSGVKFREDGWIEWSRSPDELPEQERIVPLPKELWGLCEKYVMPVAGDHSNVLTRDWDAENHGDVWWEFVFVSLLERRREGAFDTYEAVEDAYDTYEVPAADVEGLLTGIFPGHRGGTAGAAQLPPGHTDLPDAVFPGKRHLCGRGPGSDG